MSDFNLGWAGSQAHRLGFCLSLFPLFGSLFSLVNNKPYLFTLCFCYPTVRTEKCYSRSSIWSSRIKCLNYLLQFVCEAGQHWHYGLLQLWNILSEFRPQTWQRSRGLCSWTLTTSAAIYYDCHYIESIFIQNRGSSISFVHGLKIFGLATRCQPGLATRCPETTLCCLSLFSLALLGFQAVPHIQVLQSLSSAFRVYILFTKPQPDLLHRAQLRFG